jgi:hypothetical protein
MQSLNGVAQARQRVFFWAMALNDPGAACAAKMKPFPYSIVFDTDRRLYDISFF